MEKVRKSSLATAQRTARSGRCKKPADSTVRMPAQRPWYFSRDINFAWMLRSDIRESLAKWSDEYAGILFLGWWLIHGRIEYPATAPLTVEQLDLVTSPLPASFAADQSASITFLMYYLWLLRADLQQAFDIQSKEGCSRLVAWHYLCGIKEHDLPVTERDRQFLSAESEYSLEAESPLKLTNLALLLWHFRDDVRQSLGEITNSTTRRKLVCWYYLYGVKEHSLYEFMSIEERQQLLTPIVPTNRHGLTIPTWSVLALILEDDLRARFNLQDAESCAKFDHWAATEGRMRYHIDAIAQSVEHFLASKSVADEARQSIDSPRLLLRNTTRAASIKPQPRAFAAAKAFGVNLVGYATGELGIGEDVRMLAKALTAVGIPFSVINRKPSTAIRQKENSMADALADEPEFPVTIICMTGFDTVQLWLERRDVFEARTVIGYWPWELPEWPAQWREAYDLVDEIWASSHYTESAYLSTSPVPVHFMPMAVTAESVPQRSRQYFGLPDNRFIYLFVFDFMSYPARKNPFGCIDAFRKAFPQGEEPVNLVLKVSNVVKSDKKWKQILRACASDPRIILFARTIDKADVLALMHVCDAYVSLHRAEGYGRTLAEAMLLDKPVIATNYSGNTDFVTVKTGYPVAYSLTDIGTDDYPFSEGLCWAEPDTEAAAAAMRRVFEDQSTARRIGATGQRYIKAQHSPESVGARVKARLTELSKVYA